MKVGLEKKRMANAKLAQYNVVFSQSKRLVIFQEYNKDWSMRVKKKSRNIQADFLSS